VSTKIEWTDETWNPVTGCSKVSQGCKFCYAERLWPKVEGSRVKREGGAPRAFTDVRCHPERLDAPLHWRTPRRIFVNSMSDLFHEDVPDEFIDQVFVVMARAEHHTFQVLTKRPERMRQYCLSDAQFEIRDAVKYDPIAERLQYPLLNIWLGVSVEDQATADERIPLLLQTPAAVRFVSYEPALGPIDFSMHLGLAPNHDDLRGLLHQIIAGGESGPNARPSHPEWFRSARDQCANAGIAFFFKQWGEWSFGYGGEPPNAPSKQLPECIGGGRYCKMWRTGKKIAGRMLDGHEHSEYPA
jgi:protein gp37